MKSATTFLLILSISIVAHTAEPLHNRGRSKKQDQLSIVGGKALSFAVSTEDEIASTPPGKWANVYGFTYYRYTERGTGKEKVSLNGLVKEMADGVATVFDDDQRQLIADIVTEQKSIEAKATRNRIQISKELLKWRDGSKGDESKILSLAKENGQLLSTLIAQRSPVYGKIQHSLTKEQLSDLRRVRNREHKGIIPNASGNVRSKDGSKVDKKEATLLLAKFLTWSTGTEAMNQVVDAGRPAVFFGFAKMRVTNRAGSKVSKSLRRDASRALFDTLDDAQMLGLKKLVTDQSKFLEIYYETRKQIGTLVTGYQDKSYEMNLTELQKLCIQSEIAEAQLGLLQAKELGRLISSLSERQRKTLREFKEGNG